MASRRMSLVPALVALVLVPVLGACGKDGKTDATSEAAGSAVQVSAGDTTCDVDRAAFAAGPTTIKVKNGGAQTTEVYIYGADGNTFNKVINEVENIGPGTSRDMKVDLAAGTYELACKPGQKGDGIRTKLTVSGAGGAAVKAADRTVDLASVDFSFTGVEFLSAKSGETITFVMVNNGPAEHEFEVLGPDGKPAGEIGPTKKGAQGNVTVTFGAAGTYTYQCDVDDHLSRGMKGTFTVS